jgi:hypothetical protein
VSVTSHPAAINDPEFADFVARDFTELHRTHADLDPAAPAVALS